MAKTGMQKRGAGGSTRTAASPVDGPALTVIDAKLDVAGAVEVRDDLLQALARGAVRVDLSEGQPTQPAIQLLVAARNSARAGHAVSFDARAAAVLSTVIEEGV
jgi:hypothetical protein